MYPTNYCLRFAACHLPLFLLWQAMDAVWGEGDQVQVIHPAAACIAGRSMVRGQQLLHNLCCNIPAADSHPVQCKTREGFLRVCCHLPRHYALEPAPAGG